MTPREWWQQVHKAELESDVTRVLYALSVKHVGDDGVFKRPPPTFRQLAKETGLTSSGVGAAVHKALRLGWLVKAGFVSSTDWLNVLCAIGAGGKND